MHGGGMVFMRDPCTAFEAWCFSFIYDIYDKTLYGLMNEHIQFIHIFNYPRLHFKHFPLHTHVDKASYTH